MITLPEWLLEQIDADEDVALAAAEVNGTLWQLREDRHTGEPYGMVDGSRMNAHNVMAGNKLWDDEGSDMLAMAPRTAAHVALWDPGRALAWCATIRQIVAAVDVLTGGDKTYAERLQHTDDQDARYVIARDILRLLALPYADRPGYREEWRP